MAYIQIQADCMVIYNHNVAGLLQLFHAVCTIKKKKAKVVNSLWTRLQISHQVKISKQKRFIKKVRFEDASEVRLFGSLKLDICRHLHTSVQTLWQDGIKLTARRSHTCCLSTLNSSNLSLIERGPSQLCLTLEQKTMSSPFPPPSLQRGCDCIIGDLASGRDPINCWSHQL